MSPGEAIWGPYAEDPILLPRIPLVHAPSGILVTSVLL